MESRGSIGCNFSITSFHSRRVLYICIVSRVLAINQYRESNHVQAVSEHTVAASCIRVTALYCTGTVVLVYIYIIIL